MQTEDSSRDPAQIGPSAGIGRFVAPGLVTAVVAAVGAGFVEGIRHADSALGAIAAAGFAGALSAPLAVAVAVVARWTWSAWRPGQVARSMVEPGGGAPRLAAWTIYSVIAVALLAAVTFNAVRLLSLALKGADVIAIGSAIGVTSAAAILAAGSRPFVNRLTPALRSLDGAIAAPRSKTLFRPRAILAIGLFGLGAYVVGAWLVSIRPRVGHVGLGWLWYAAPWAALLVLAHVGWERMSARARSAAALAALAAAAAVSATTAYVRVARPFVMIDVWGDAPVGGFVIGRVYDLEQLRRTMNLGEIAPTPRPGANHPDVVLITIDTVRADRLSVHGGSARTPALELLARGGAVFERAYSPGNVTRRSLPTMVTGASPHRVIGRVAGWAIRLDPRHVLLAERLRAARYQTAGFFCCESHFGPLHRMSLDRGIEAMVFEKQGDELANRMLDWLMERDADPPDRPLFAWMHMYDPHDWKALTKKRARGKTTKDRYDLVLADVDRYLAPLLAYLRSGKRPNSAIIVVTSDHGESLGDHGQPTHATTLFNTEIHVPLIIAGPGIPPVRIGMPVGLVDLTPTLLDLAGFEPPGMPTMDGVSRAAVVRGREPALLDDGDVYAVMVEDRSVNESAHAVIQGRHKLMVRGTRAVRLYDIVADPQERNNLAQKRPKLLERLKARLDQRRQVDRVPVF